MSKKCSDQFYYAVRIGRKPGIYRGWYGEYGAKTQITGIRNYDYSTGYLKTSSWEDADAYMRTHELFVVESDFTIKKATSFNEDMSVVHGETRVAAKETPAQPPAAPATENAFFPPSAPSVPYHRDEKLESFLHAYYPDRRFTDDQKAAIQALSGAHLLYAIPGSGKTAVLTARAGWMIHCGIPAENILIMTFGKKAAEHMADVFRERFPSFSVPFFCTIHSFCYRIIRQAEAEGLIKKYRLIVDEEDDPVPEAMDGETANAWIVDESPDEVPSGRTKREDKKKGNRYANPRSPIYLLEKILTKLEYCKKQSEARTFAEQAATVIGCLKNRRMTDEEIRRLSPIDMGADEPVSIWSVYEAYQKELTEHQPPEMDFDDMLIHALEVLDNPNMQAFWQRKYPYVCVDEAQDTSRLQHAIVQKLHRTGDSLFMVGDDDQSIYAFRGAMPEDMLTFDRRYEDAAVHRMGVNFRSDQQIVLSGDGLIQRNKARAKKTMEAFSKQPGEIRIIDISAARQGQFLLDQARRFCKKQEGEENPESLAILYRNNVSALLPLAYFFKNDVPFVGNKVFDVLTLLYSRTAINILAFLRFVLEPDSFQAYSSAYPVWNHYHGLFLNRETAVENLRKQMGEENSGGPILPKLQALLRSLGEMAKARHIGEIWTILQRIQAEDKPDFAIMAMLKELEYNQNGSMKQKNVQLLVMALIQIASLYDSISSFVDAMLALRAKRKWDEHNADKQPVVTLSTMHSAKGQEYDHVIIIDAVKDLMPGDPSKPLPFWHAFWQDHEEEERRLFYVAVTRARHDLRIVVNGLNSNGQQAPSPFIHEMLRDNPNIQVENLTAYAAHDALEEQIEEAMGIPYFAVRRGKTPGIHREYEKAGVEGYSCPVYRKCTTEREAQRFLNKAVSCPVPETETAPDLPLPVEKALLRLFSVQQLKELDANRLKKIRPKTGYLFSKEAIAAKAVDYAACAPEYALIYLPVNLHKVRQPLIELLRDEMLPLLDEFKYPDGAHPIRILEMGAGPGTATIGLLSFYAKIAEENPSLEIHLEYLPVEYERAFRPIFEALTAAMLSALPANLHICMKPMQISDAFAFLHTCQADSFDLILESNMLNHNEHVESRLLNGLLHDMNRTLVYSGKVIAIEPADKETAAFLVQLAGLAKESCGFSVMGPKDAACDVSGIRLYQEAVACGLRHPLEKDCHYFHYTVLTKKQEVSP